MNAADGDPKIELSIAELREITRYAVACAEPALEIFERARPNDQRPRDAIDAARAFAAGGKRTKAIRDSAWAAHRAHQDARDSGQAAASDAARAAVAAASAAFLHPLAKATQVLHILGPAAHTARAFELDDGDDSGVGAEYLERARDSAGPVVVSVLARYPNAPSGRGRVGELMRNLDASLRQPTAAPFPWSPSPPSRPPSESSSAPSAGEPPPSPSFLHHAAAPRPRCGPGAA
ncbi:putative immunity protein [Nocardia brasiliensis]|uniref:putative immunity protein n=1 Tax=Nocardia brasiliensis TaxID=37326 RepID=UPI003671222E